MKQKLMEMVLERLENHLKAVEDSPYSTNLYIRKVKAIIDRIRSGYYETERNEWLIPAESELIRDLQSIGFGDLAKQVERGFYQ